MLSSASLFHRFDFIPPAVTVPGTQLFRVEFTKNIGKCKVRKEAWRDARLKLHGQTQRATREF